MFNNLVSTLVNWMASGLDFAINWIIKMLGFNISFFTDNFPVVLTLYGILQGVGIALVIAIAIFQLYMFFAGPLSDKAATSSPFGNISKEYYCNSADIFRKLHIRVYC